MSESGPRYVQPWIHQLTICVDGNGTALSDHSGDIAPIGAQGFYVDDRRVISTLGLQVGGQRPVPVAHAASGARAEFTLSARNVGDMGPDPTVEVRRSRTVIGSGLTEIVTITSRAAVLVSTELRIELASDGADIGYVKAGKVEDPLIEPHVDPLPPTAPAVWRVRYADARHETTVSVTPAPEHADVAAGVVAATFPVRLEPGASAMIAVRVRVSRLTRSMLDADAGSEAIGWANVRVHAGDARVGVLVQRSLDDLRHLVLRDPESPQDLFAAAGTPWYLTLFGRDSIWAARMTLPFGTALAGGTLRALARRQGTVDDLLTAEAPGKIPHELRRSTYVDPVTGMTLPPEYYGTVDATALWITLLWEAWRWGLPEEEVRGLLPALSAAVDWLATDAMPHGDGFLKYIDTAGTGLTNQGWKDSGDSIRWRDGRIADAPIALVEAQAYAVEALHHAADLFRAFDLGDAAAADSAAAGLSARVREEFWVSTDAGRYLAIALDAQGAAVDGLASNMGHVLGTGTLLPPEAGAVAETITGDELLDGFGVRTLGTGNRGFNPNGYHTGSIWTHDTAIAAWGLAREGRGAEAARVVQTLVESGEAFDYRWPELYSGLPLLAHPAPYPASCRPQAWSAASVGVLVLIALGITPDAPARRLIIAPNEPAPFGAIHVEGLRFAGHEFAVRVDSAGEVSVTGLPDDVTVELPDPATR